MRFLTVFGLVALAEMATFFWVESQIGLGWALGIAIATALIGSALVRRAGLAVLGRLRRKVSQGELPGRELSDGAAVLVAGAFLISPGFLTDTLGFLLLIPAIRAQVYRYVSNRISSGGRGAVVTGGSAGQYWSGRSDSGDIIDIEPED
jgi:UPF0716 protein FxsA